MDFKNGLEIIKSKFLEEEKQKKIINQDSIAISFLGHFNLGKTHVLS
jgi:hypothetical protein